MTTSRLTIRIGNRTLSFSQMGENGAVTYEPYQVRGTISMAANLREACKSVALVKPSEVVGDDGRNAIVRQRALVMVDSKALLVPIDLYKESEKDELYRHAFPSSSGDMVMQSVLPDLETVTLFAVNRDLHLVVTDNFRDPIFINAANPVWQHLYRRSFNGPRGKLFAYFHDGRLDLMSYAKNRFKFCNTYDIKNGHNALYFILYVWKQLQLQPEADELHLVGDIVDRDWLLEQLRRYLLRAYVINPDVDFNHAPATEIPGIPYDLMTLFTKGR